MKAPRDKYGKLGFLSQALPLTDPSVLPDLLADAPLFDAALKESQAEDRHMVPYLVTGAIRRVAQDASILKTVQAILGTNEWVMWGANIRRATPNQAHNWHVDLESLHWPSVTVAIGLHRCSPQSATWCVPGTHRLKKPPPEQESEVLSRGNPQQIQDFGDGRFYVFDARVWHKGDSEYSANRVVLFTHYQRADHPRIPLMLDYVKQSWAQQAAPYFTTAPPARVSTNLATVSLRQGWAKRPEIQIERRLPRFAQPARRWIHR